MTTMSHLSSSKKQFLSGFAISYKGKINAVNGSPKKIFNRSFCKISSLAWKHLRLFIILCSFYKLNLKKSALSNFLANKIKITSLVDLV